MGQIVKKKGRPSKADLAARAATESSNRHHNYRRLETAAEEQHDVRRSFRRRSCVRYNLIGYEEDYLEDDEEFEVVDDESLAAEEGRGMREKRFKFAVKLHNSGGTIRSNVGVDSMGQERRADGWGSGLEEPEVEEEDGEEEEENPVAKKKKISGDVDEDDDYGDNDDDEDRVSKGESSKGVFVDGTLNDIPSQTPMPEKKKLELILDKLQKKDTYGVYAEPVDPEELPDYHDIIKHPMDFATVRKKLADGSYSIFEQFESDVYLICSNAMQYNAPDTIYHKQACAIKELAQKKFQRVRVDIERSRIENGRTVKEAMSEQKTELNPKINNQMKKPIGCNIHDPISYDFTSGATLATTDVRNTSNGVQASNCGRPTNSEGLVEGISSFVEGNIEKLEVLQPGKAMTPKFGKRPLVVDENRRGTYEISNQLLDRSESKFSTFEGEDKQLIPVGLYGEHSYAQSLARFAATLGPVAWRIASKRIERALPPGSKFGRAWVVEYEPPPTPVLFIASQPLKEYLSATKPQSPAVSLKIDKLSEALVSSGENVDVSGPTSNRRPCFLPCPGGSRLATPSGTVTQQQNPFVRKLQNASVPVKGDKPSVTPARAYDREENRPLSDVKPSQLTVLGESRPATPTGAATQQQNLSVRTLLNASVSVPGKIDETPESFVTASGSLDVVSTSEDKSPALPHSRGSRPISPTVAVIQLQNPFSRSNLRPENMAKNRVEAYGPTITSQDTNLVVQKQFPSSAEMATSSQEDMIARNKNFLQPVPFRSPPPANQAAITGRFPNGNINGSVDVNPMASLSPAGVCTQFVGTKTSFPPSQEQGLRDPVQAMRHLAGNAQKQQNRPSTSHGPLQVWPSIQSPRGSNKSGAMTAAASAWMSVGAGVNKPPIENPSVHSNQIPAESLSNANQELYSQILQSGEHPVSGTMHFRPERGKACFQEPVSNHAKASNESQVRKRSTSFPHILMNDLSRVPLRGLSPHGQQKQKQDTLPPDLNIAFQSTVDPQQPDLALQL